MLSWLPGFRLDLDLDPTQVVERRQGRLGGEEPDVVVPQTDGLAAKVGVGGARVGQEVDGLHGPPPGKEGQGVNALVVQLGGQDVGRGRACGRLPLRNHTRMVRAAGQGPGDVRKGISRPKWRWCRAGAQEG